MATATKFNVEPKTPETAQEPATSVLNETQQKMGMIPNMYAYMAVNPALLDAYNHAYNSFRENAGFNAVEQEVILLSISYENECDYCMAAHSFLADSASGVPSEVKDAIRNGQEVPDAKLNALSKFARKMVEKRGWVNDQDLEAFLDAGYDKSQVHGIIAAIGAKVMSNYSNHISKTPLDAPFQSYEWSK